jgi:hypothetical protein
LNQTGSFTVRRFIASITPATGKGVNIPTTNPDSESGECRERNEDRCSTRIAGNELDAWTHQVAFLQLVVKSIPLQAFDVESSLQTADQPNHESV